MVWYEHENPNGSVVWSTRIRLAANLASSPFPARLTSSGREEAANKIKSIFEGNQNYSIMQIDRLTPLERAAFTEAHMASPAFMQGDLAGRLLILSSDGECAIMVNEEDHIRLQCIKVGYQPQEAYKKALDVFRFMEEKLEFSFDPELGYLSLGAALTDVPSVKMVKGFVEKPSVALATELNTQGALWNTMVTCGTVDALWELGRATDARLIDILDSFVPLVGTADEDDAIEYIYRAYLPVSFSRDMLERARRRARGSAVRAGRGVPAGGAAGKGAATARRRPPPSSGRASLPRCATRRPGCPVWRRPRRARRPRTRPWVRAAEAAAPSAGSGGHRRWRWRSRGRWRR